MNLQLTHVTPWESFLSIMKDGNLIPQRCHLFREDLLYMNYGRLAHKPSKKDYNWDENLPVVLFFDSDLLDQSIRFFPFDTGAIISGRFKYTNLNDGKMIKQIASRTLSNYSPSKWIKTNYSKPSNYIKCESPDLMVENSKLNTMLKEAYSILKKPNNTLDYRLTSVECHFNSAVPLRCANTIAVPFEKKIFFSKENIPPNINIFYYADKSIDGYLPSDLTNFANSIFHSRYNGS